LICLFQCPLLGDPAPMPPVPGVSYPMLPAILSAAPTPTVNHLILPVQVVEPPIPIFLTVMPVLLPPVPWLVLLIQYG